MIIVRLWGGLGNQLFQYAFGQYLAKRFKVDVAYDVASFGTSDILRKLEVKGIVPNFKEYNASFSKYTGVKNRVLRLCYQMSNTFIDENFFSLDNLDKIVTRKGDVYLQGYWQNERYAQCLLQSNICSMWQTSCCLKQLELQIKESKFSISVHVRRGDYFSPKNVGIYGVCDADYYNRAASIIAEKSNGDALFFVFSDDIDWVKTNIPLPQNTVYIPNYDVPQFSYIYLMSLCHANIISNSTFSWWGAYLNMNLETIVISPKKWTLKTNETIALDRWIKI